MKEIVVLDDEILYCGKSVTEARNEHEWAKQRIEEGRAGRVNWWRREETGHWRLVTMGRPEVDRPVKP